MKTNNKIDISLNSKLKEVKERGETYTIFTDGSAELLCRNCGKIDYVAPDSKAAINANQIPDYAMKYWCFNCWDCYFRGF